MAKGLAIISIMTTILLTIALYSYLAGLYAYDRVSFSILGVFNLLLFWTFPIISTIIYYYLGKERDFKAGRFCAINFVIMYATIFGYAFLTAQENQLSHNIFEGEIMLIHVMHFLVGLALSWVVGNILIKTISHHSLYIHD